MEEPSNTILEEREELMVSPTGGKPYLRKAHFLSPSTTSMNTPLPKVSYILSAKPTASELNQLAAKVQFKGWRYPKPEWNKWIEKLQPKYETVWEQAGIYEAIMSSKYHFHKHKELILWLVEKWCPQTNTFIFPWGESTVTLEDMIVLGSFSVLGDSVCCDIRAKELVRIEEKLFEALTNASKSRPIRASHHAWIVYFMENESEIEHEAFLVEWLSKFVFPENSYSNVGTHVFPIAILLARGTRFALAPAVLSSIYKDLSILKHHLINLTMFETDEVLTLFSPLQFVQLWAWERFIDLRPIPNNINRGDHRSARWHRPKYVMVKDVRSVLDSAGKFFKWRPYSMALNGWVVPEFYQSEEEWVSVDEGLSNELLSYAYCVRACDLVGLDSVEKYLPHRVAMQFGFDQDIPGDFAKSSNINPVIACSNYFRPIQDAKLYIPQRLLESDVTTRYVEWRNNHSPESSRTILIDVIKPHKKHRMNSGRSPRKFRKTQEIYKDNDPSDDSDQLLSSHYYVEGGNSVEHDEQCLLKTVRSNHGEENLCGDEDSVGGSKKDIENPSESKTENPSKTEEVKFQDGEGEKMGYNHDHTTDFTEMELEDRISRLEMIVDELKARRFGPNSKS